MKSQVQANYIGCSPNPAVLRRSPLPEVLFMGRSNVGKSSLINCLVNSRNLARTSSTPGKTRLFYFYEIDERMLFVDPPGYGYAKVAEAMRTRWMQEMERYLRKAELLKGVVLIMDIRHAPTPIDYEMALWLAESRIDFVSILNKADKLSRNQRNAAINRVHGEMNFEGAGPIIPFSANTGEGRSQLWNSLEEWIGRVG
ncbi:MAG: ribosome biogenesis GTP-binding protein YihA/YsxC [bacterium]|nr:ribosome biogenesis GTP-binding protein YihA/YsxC [bacterium]